MRQGGFGPRKGKERKEKYTWLCASAAPCCSQHTTSVGSSGENAPWERNGHKAMSRHWLRFGRDAEQGLHGDLSGSHGRVGRQVSWLP